MKKVLLIVFIALGCNFSFSQNNLEFNNALYASFTSNTAGGEVVGSITVPSGKVWKIEARSVVRNYNTNTGERVATIGTLLAYQNGDNKDYSQSPIWLPAGTYEVRINAVNGGPCVFTYSGVEFNLVP